MKSWKEIPSEMASPLNNFNLIRRLNTYKFKDVSDAIRFLEIMCGPILTTNEYIYIRSKISQCLRLHDDGNDDFIPLRQLAAEIDCLI